MQKSAGRSTPPPALIVGASLAAVEALVLVGYGVAELASVAGGRIAVALTTGVFFALYGGFLGWCAYALYRLHSWARSPVVLAQLIQIGVALSFWGGATKPVAITLIAVAVVTLVGVLHPASVDALAE